MEQTFNKKIPVKRYDVTAMKHLWRIVFFPENSEMIVTKRPEIAKKLAVAGSIVLTKSNAPKAFPGVFVNTSIETVRDEAKVVMVRLSAEQYAFCHRSMRASNFIRGLIDEQMKKQ